MVYSAMWNVPTLSQEGYILLGVQHTIVESIQVDKSKIATRNKIKIPIPTPNNKKKKKRTKEEAEAFFNSRRKAINLGKQNGR